MPTVLFVCVKNGGKSQMAAALTRLEAAGSIDVLSCGTQPGSTLNEESRAAIEEVGATFEGEYPKGLEVYDADQVDRVIAIGAEADMAAFADAASVEVWEVDEPSLRGIEGMERMRLVRDDIHARVRQLVKELAAG